MASALDTVRQGVELRLFANWTDTEIAWQGHEFDPGEDDWIRPTLRFGGGRLESYSSTGVNTVDGLLLIDCFTVSKSGLGVLYGYVDELRDLFDRVTVGAVEFLAASGPREVSDSLWQGLQFEVPFIVIETS